MINIIKVSQYNLPNTKDLDTSNNEIDLEGPEDDISLLADEMPKREESKAPEPNAVPLADDDLDVNPLPDGDIEVPEMIPEEAITSEQPEPINPIPTPEPEPEDNFEEVAPIQEKEAPKQDDGPQDKQTIINNIWNAMNNELPLRIIYTSLAGLTTERTVYPDYIYWAGTNRHVLVAWDTLKNDWRAFIQDRIRKAKLDEKQQVQVVPDKTLELQKDILS